MVGNKFQTLKFRVRRVGLNLECAVNDGLDSSLAFSLGYNVRLSFISRAS